MGKALALRYDYFDFMKRSSPGGQRSWFSNRDYFLAHVWLGKLNFKYP
jgi:hypothetical protein